METPLKTKAWLNVDSANSCALWVHLGGDWYLYVMDDGRCGTLTSSNLSFSLDLDGQWERL